MKNSTGRNPTQKEFGVNGIKFSILKKKLILQPK
jgi:hypothetical protein